MTRDQARRIEMMMQDAYPDADVTVERTPGGARIEIYQPGSTMVAVVGSVSAVVVMLAAWRQ